VLDNPRAGHDWSELLGDSSASCILLAVAAVLG